MTRRVAAALGGLAALAAMWLPWYQPKKGDVIILFGALDRQPAVVTPTAWQAFAWEDVVLAALAVATFGVAAAGRRWFLVPALGLVFTAGVMIAHPSVDQLREIEQTGGPPMERPVPATAAALVALVGFAVAAAALAAGRYRWRR